MAQLSIQSLKDSAIKSGKQFKPSEARILWEKNEISLFVRKVVTQIQ